MPSRKGYMTQRVMRPLVCSEPGCDCGGVMVMLPACHPGESTRAWYHKETGTLEIKCAVCGSVVCEYLIAEDEEL